MKYFTPTLLARYRSDDENVAEAAAKEWDNARVRYRRRLKHIRERLPVGARRLCDDVSLHDAKLIAILIGKNRPSFSLLMQLVSAHDEPSQQLELRYGVVSGADGGASFERHDPTTDANLDPMYILYDEFDVGEASGHFTHSLLLTGGELVVHFTSLSVRIGEVISPPQLPIKRQTWSADPGKPLRARTVVSG